MCVCVCVLFFIPSTLAPIHRTLENTRWVSLSTLGLWSVVTRERKMVGCGDYSEDRSASILSLMKLPKQPVVWWQIVLHADG